MIGRSSTVWTSVLLAFLLLLAACGGGSGGGFEPDPDNPFTLFIQTNPESGPSPLVVSFFAVPSNGAAPFTYAWDFDGDGTTDSNASSGTFTFTETATSRVTVTDDQGQTVSAQKSIIITPGNPPPPGDALTVKFAASTRVGNVPFNVQFNPIITGGEAPYSYAWDFEGDGTFDSFLEAPLYTYQLIGQKISDTEYLHFPVLRVIDGRGITATNLDDLDNDGNPDYKLSINALPPAGGMSPIALANPTTGQAPLTVEFTGSVTGGSDSYEFTWDFGDGQTAGPTSTSITTHLYAAAGTFQARVTVLDLETSEVAVSSPVTINALVPQEFGLTITADVSSGQVPFVVNMEANPVNGSEPIVYNWDVFTDEPIDPLPSITDPPSLDPAAVVTPHFSLRKNPEIVFGNTAGTGAAFNYIVRCVARDSVGNEAISNLVRVTAHPNTTYPFYDSFRPMITASTSPTPDGSSNPNPALQALPVPVPWGARANPAVCTHPSGLTFVFGGEVLDENGLFEDLVQRGDSVYAFLPPTGGHVSTTDIGKYSSAFDGSMIHLNDNTRGAFPGPADRMGAVPSQRSAPFTIVGSAAAVFMHEEPETNEEETYFEARQVAAIEAMANLPYPDSPSEGWQLDSWPTQQGLGTPIIYVLGGRTDETTPVDLVQKYYVWGFGSEDLPFDSLDGWPPGLLPDFQTTANQVDIWSPFFLRPDTDQVPGNDPPQDPQIQNRTPNAQGVLARLAVPVYGLMAVKVQNGVRGSGTGVDAVPPAFPGGPFGYVFTFGGITPTGLVSDEMRWWDTAESLDTATDPGEADGMFSLVATMPTPRAYGQAVLVPGSPLRIALVGGIDNFGNQVNTIDVFEFDDAANPQTGAWQTFAGTLPEALEASGAGFNPGTPTEDWILAMGGWTGEKFSESTYTVRLGSQGDKVILEPNVVIPRSNAGSAQSGAAPNMAYPPPIGVDYNRYIMVGGISEIGAESIVEVVSLP